MSSAATAMISPPILFFILGFGAQFLKTDLRLPQSISKFFAIYLLVVIGFEGGLKVSTVGVDTQFLMILLTGIVFALLHPIMAYFISKPHLDADTSVALSASYGSVSLVTFIAALSFLDLRGYESSSYFVAVLAVMEFPAILIGVLIHGIVSKDQRESGGRLELLREALLGAAPLMLLGSFMIGYLTNQEGALELQSFTRGLFKGFLSLYLLDTGARAAKELKGTSVRFFHFCFGIGFPIFKGIIGCFVAVYLLKLSPGNSLLLAILFASASYIAVPAAMSTMLPKANRGVYVTLPLAITFPFNVIIGIPAYMAFIDWLTLL